MKKPELLLPAGNLERLKTAFMYGADAVYAGIPSVSLRNKISFTIDELKEGISFAHKQNKKVYLTMNLFTHNQDIPKVKGFIEDLKFLNPDGLIVADGGVFDLVKKEIPNLPLHISTQANICSTLTVKFWENLGASLCVLGRETPFKEIKEIRQACPNIKLEMFIHGALCISYSGRCLLSNFLTGRSANKGNCAHTCRWKYNVYIEEENRPGELMPFTQDSHGTYIMNSKDLCLMPRLKELLGIGMDSFKIEGRNKSEYYVALTARTYRQAIDSYFKDPENFDYQPFMNELYTLHSRGFTVGFFDGNAGPEAQNYEQGASASQWRYTAIIREVLSDSIEVEVKHKITPGLKIEIITPQEIIPFEIQELKSLNENKVESVSAGALGQSIKIILPPHILNKMQIGYIIRSKEIK